MKKLYFFTTVFVILISCSSDNDSRTKEPVGNIFYKTVTSNFESPVPVESKYTFDGNKVLSIKTDKTETLFTYEENRIVKQEVITKDQFGEEYKEKELQYVYENGKLRTKTTLLWVSYYLDEVSSTSIVTYTHISDNLIEHVTHFIHPYKEKEKIDEGFIKYKDGNIVEKFYSSFYGTTVFNYEYDTKNNPARNILGYDLLLDEIDDCGKNNIVKTTFKSSEAPYVNEILRTYIYDDKGYPVKYTSVASNGYRFKVEFTY
ncbi:hypothetical protein [Flavobacterium hercynium]|uniref:DUF4595 domain-containing protein n=1 Tax=Flavobacterium hercynium TaxID=387094 RepID=A0A226GPQ7_9FLAO|nr:hypothetical protein [Flavobacterium hercynium]OXA83396.1 hypothetical protein B0A66_22355 [Flavobacterium hercynium]SMP31681.1 hypothetical protein SAMN06265346_11461 [Flavobacterium hercynium]